MVALAHMPDSLTRKIVVHSAGSYDHLELETSAVPVPGPGEVRIDVRAIGVNYADAIVRMGLYASAKEYVGWPITPGFEVAGAVGAIGSGVTVAIAGAGLFFASDLAIGWSRFVDEFAHHRMVIIVTYHVAQILLVGSLVVAR